MAVAVERVFLFILQFMCHMPLYVLYELVLKRYTYAGNLGASQWGRVVANGTAPHAK
jgi:hypothetical protein